MIRSGFRVRGAAAAASAAVLATVLLGCDATGGNSPTPQGAPAARSAKPSPSPTPTWDTSPESVAAVGDSITRGFDACQVLSDCPESSWATGTDPAVNSLAVRLLGKEAAATRSWNFARTGARMSALPEQMKQAAEKSPELVTVLMGANDACRGTAAAMTSVASFRADFEDGMRALRRELPKTQVYVASIPDLTRLWSQGKGNAMAKQIWKLGICQSMLADPDALDDLAVQRRGDVHARVEAYNKVLKDVCAEDEYCRYDGGSVFGYRFGPGQLSKWDWFHPSRDGQARLAELAFTAVTAEQSPGE
ncbi:SGNH/GDSL hydrolase family protein [Streptomyces indicus]|uniref:Lysophospholipase L1 n=1 Tax=Streptomyces indicus TaxID=417292 RepID=A0A1G9IKJ9_9ACTN|nr:SGNH/GDSL hydrolase family protein [Streptomyces indicus]SDL25575.1 Lysophospholipase L1 [Streptomyces indicus]